ncbi:hypothetical protein GJ699_22015 [Duganella sp. FT80W]|uniref:Uncharacterized protein n=1 Tax=Duganella guangzhouensis TaxID=2666084 RepID=A0A6I2L3H1_9BURK|nr:hypothetical protein [Duganella guangzhouensis]MRW92678.1 hypothetical protein [Duganella guangzhouensis]
MKKLAVPVTAALACLAWLIFRPSAPTILSLRVGQTFNEVTNLSSFPVMASSNIPDARSEGNGATWVTTPSVIIQFNDPTYGFTLPPTTFAAVDYMNYRVTTISTSPMLNKLPFDDAFEIAKSLQQQLQDGGWQPENQTTWLDLGDKRKLQQNLRRNDPTYRNYVELVAPQKYSIIFRFYCSERCDSLVGLDRYLIDVGIGKDYGFEIERRNERHLEW